MMTGSVLSEVQRLLDELVDALETATAEVPRIAREALVIRGGEAQDLARSLQDLCRVVGDCRPCVLCVNHEQLVVWERIAAVVERIAAFHEREERRYSVRRLREIMRSHDQGDGPAVTPPLRGVR